MGYHYLSPLLYCTKLTIHASLLLVFVIYFSVQVRSGGITDYSAYNTSVPEDEHASDKNISISSVPAVIGMLKGNDVDENWEIMRKVLKNRHIVFIGDSMMRYQYIDFVYFLKHGNHVHDSEKNNPIFANTWASWFDFHKGVNKLLSPYEHCDCFKGSSEHTFENRLHILLETYIFTDTLSE